MESPGTLRPSLSCVLRRQRNAAARLGRHWYCKKPSCQASPSLWIISFLPSAYISAALLPAFSTFPPPPTHLQTRGLERRPCRLRHPSYSSPGGPQGHPSQTSTCVHPQCPSILLSPDQPSSALVRPDQPCPALPSPDQTSSAVFRTPEDKNLGRRYLRR